MVGTNRKIYGGDTLKPRFYDITRLPVTRWVKLSLNFEFLVPK